MNQKQGTIKILAHESAALKNNPLGDAYIRDVTVYLPPDYEKGEKRFPVVYLLTGFGGRGQMLLNDNPFAPNLAQRMDSLISKGKIKPMIVIMPDCFTRFGGSQYINSMATGDYEDYFTKEIVAFVDAQFRTVADRDSRAVMGKSSGGYGAFVCALRHADKFGLICATAGDCYFEYEFLPDFPKAFRVIKGNPLKIVEKFWDETKKKEKDDFAALNIVGMSACYSPNPDSEFNFDLPFDLQTGAIRHDVWARWLAHDPVRLVEKHVENLKSLKLFYIDAGTRDEFYLDLGARILCEKLKKFDVPFVHEEFSGGHLGISYRYNRSLELISEHFPANV